MKPLEERILLELKKANMPLTPKQISVRTRIKHNTVKVYARKMLMDGLVGQPYPGAYSYKTHPRCGEPPPRVQNLILRVAAPWLRNKIETIKKQVGDVGIRIIFGVKRRKITGLISRDQGMDSTQTIMALELFRLLIAQRTNQYIDYDKIEVCSCEFLEDYSQLRLDGVKCVTVTSFLGDLERVYNRKFGLRSEVKVQPQDVNTIMTLLKGGVSTYNIVQGQFMMVQKIKNLTDSVKGTNRLTSTLMTRLIGLMEELLRRMQRDE